MKQCPACRRAYADEALKFCTKDGTPLAAGGHAGSDTSATLALPPALGADSAPTRMLAGDGAHTAAAPAVEAGAGAGAANSALATGPRVRRGGAGRRRLLVGSLLAACAAVALVYSYMHARGNEVVIESVAVLPFENQTREQETDYLSDGLTESIINGLSQLPGLRVIPRATVFRHKGGAADPLAAGRSLGVRAVVVGRVLQRGDGLTVSAELVDVRDEKQLWGEQYARKLSDLAVVQQEISREISEKLRRRLSGDERTRLARRGAGNAEAYQLYLRGRYHWNKRTNEGFERAAGYFRQAIERDPTYALAYAGLADCYLLGPGEQWRRAPLVKEAAERALALDPTLAEAHTTLAFHKTLNERDWVGARAEFEEALRLDPDYPTAHQWFAVYWMLQGRHEASLREIDRAIELDPLSLIINTDKGRILFYMRRYDEAVAQLRETLRIDPDFAVAHQILGACYVEKGLYEEAVAEYSKARQLGFTEGGTLGKLGYVYARAGRRDEARKVLEELSRRRDEWRVSPYTFASIYSALGERERALALLERVVDEGAGSQPFIKVDPAFDNLRGDPRFAELLRRAGLRP